MEGNVSLPLLGNQYHEYYLDISTIPSSESKQPVQPNLIHVTLMNESTRKATWKSKLTKKDWRIRLKIQGQKAFLVLCDEVGVQVEEKEISCIKDNKLILGEDGLLLTIITPLQDKSRGDPSGVRIHDVIKDRLEVECADGVYKNADMEVKCKEIAEQYTNRKKNPVAKIEMHR